MIGRRAVLAGLGAALAAPALAHTPYRQWVIYRRKHLLIGCHRGDDAGYARAKAVVETLATHLPDARARAARAPSAPRLAGLIATDQMDVAVLHTDAAMGMAEASGPFESYGPQPLTTLARLGDTHLLVAHSRFKGAHAGLVSEALADKSTTPAEPPLPWHPGVHHEAH